MNEQSSSTVVELQSQSFLTSGLNLKRLLNSVAKESKNAVEALVGLLASKDEKIQLAAAKALLELHVSVAKEINSDQLNRLIAETKLGNGKRLVSPNDDDDDDDRPLVDFTTVQEIR